MATIFAVLDRALACGEVSEGMSVDELADVIDTISDRFVRGPLRETCEKYRERFASAWRKARFPGA